MKRAFILAAIVAALPYLRTPIYRFPAPVPFSGSGFYDPYDGVSGPWSKSVWQRANFHAHSVSWSGLTNGQQPDEEVAQAYRKLGYAVPGISNYHHISLPPDGSEIPIFEHGYNAGKYHQLAIGASSVEWFDFPLFQFASQKQFIINLLKARADLVAIAHPSGRKSYLTREMRALTGYQLLEVVNGPFADDEPWDAALSSGRPVWGLANDDSHDTSDADRMGLSWNMVAAASASRSAIVDALRGGHFYSMMRLYDNPNAELTNIETVDFKDGTLTISVSGAIPAFEFFGQGGIVKKVVRDVRTASYTFDSTDTYVRTIIWTPRHVIYLNPIIRWDGQALPNPVATVNQPLTWLTRTLMIAAAGLALYMTRKRRS